MPRMPRSSVKGVGWNPTLPFLADLPRTRPGRRILDASATSNPRSDSAGASDALRESLQLVTFAVIGRCAIALPANLLPTLARRPRILQTWRDGGFPSDGGPSAQGKKKYGCVV